MENYKGIYYKDTKEQKYYEGGAHFKYKTLFNALLSLGGLLIEDNKNNYLINSDKKQQFKSNKDINSLLIKVEGKQSKYKTRNIGQFNYLNNPNTQIKQTQNNQHHKKNNLSLKDYNNNRNNNFGYFMEKKHSYCKRAITSLSINDENKKIVNNNLIQMLLNKNALKNEVKIDVNNYYSKYMHNRNNSDALTNINNTLFNKINIIKKYDTKNKSYIRSININNNKIMNKNLCSLEINGQENIKNDKNESINIQKINHPYIYGKSKIGLSKENSKLNKHLTFYSNKNKKSRNIVNHNNLANNFNNENNKTNDNNNKNKFINNYLFSTYEYNNKKENDNLTNNTISNNIISVNNNIFNSINIKNKEKILKSNGNNLIMQRYIRKKVNQLCAFNHNNCHIKKNLKQKI